MEHLDNILVYQFVMVKNEILACVDHHIKPALVQHFKIKTRTGENMKQKVLLCSDLDRTIIPNGDALESKRARTLLDRLADLPMLTLAYVTGRNEGMIRAAIDEYGLPQPDYAVGDVGTTIYSCGGPQWTPLPDWDARIGNDWPSGGGEKIAETMREFPELELQEQEKQGRFKLSYYASTDFGSSENLRQVTQTLMELDANLEPIWSIDEAAGRGLLDILPHSATKLGAVRFLMEREATADGRTVFAGDSGNDLPVLTSEIQSILVANARDEIKQRAKSEQAQHGSTDSLYVAQGSFHGLNGNYAAGVIEGVCHFLPELEPLLFR